jgi:hypothetical protein
VSLLGCGPVGRPERGDEALDVALLPREQRRCGRAAVTDIERRLRREALAERREVLEPRRVVAVREVGVDVVVGDVAGEDDRRGRGR